MIAQPPYMPVLDLAAGWQGVRDFAAALSFDNYSMLVLRLALSHVVSHEPADRGALDSILLLIGYPIAYGIARTPRRAAADAGDGGVLPFWTAFLIRIYAWINILQREGLLNEALMALGFIGEPMVWLATDTAIYIGIVYSYLPFMVLPLYASLEKMDETLLEAAADLGARAGRRSGWSRAAVAAGHHRRRAAVLHPDGRRVRHPRSARRLGTRDDRPDAVDRILPQQGLAGGVRSCRRAARRPAGRRS